MASRWRLCSILSILVLVNIVSLVVVFEKRTSLNQIYELGSGYYYISKNATGDERQEDCPSVNWNISASSSSGDEDSGFSDIWEALSGTVPSAPVELMRDRGLLDPGAGVKKCGWFPQPWNLFIANEHWQMLKLPEFEVYLYSAHLDTREAGRPAVRLVTMINRAEPAISDLQCLLWYPDLKEPDYADVSDAQRTGGMGRPRDGVSNPFLLSCQVNNGTRGIPEAVSLVGRREKYDKFCTKVATNCLKLVHQERTNPEPRVAVCVKGISFSNPMMVPRLVEWIELLFILGVDKIFFHYTNLARENLNVLRFYEARGKVELQEYIWAGPYARDENFQKFYRTSVGAMTKQDNVPYNYCYYSSMEQHYDYLAILDVDEVIMPRKHENLLDMLEDLERAHPTRSTFTFRNTYFMNSMLDSEAYSKNPRYDQTVPEHMHMLRHLVRSEKHTKAGVPKSIVKTGTSFIKTVMAHHPSSCLDEHRCASHWVDPELAHMTHYREGCQLSQRKICHEYTDNTVEDLAILRFKDDLVERAEATLKSLNFNS